MNGINPFDTDGYRPSIMSCFFNTRADKKRLKLKLKELKSLFIIDADESISNVQNPETRNKLLQHEQYKIGMAPLRDNKHKIMKRKLQRFFLANKFIKPQLTSDQLTASLSEHERDLHCLFLHYYWKRFTWYYMIVYMIPITATSLAMLRLGIYRYLFLVPILLYFNTFRYQIAEMTLYSESIVFCKFIYKNYEKTSSEYKQLEEFLVSNHLKIEKLI